MSKLELNPSNSDSEDSKGTVPDKLVFDIVLAPFWKRLIAWLIDGALVGIIGLTILYFFAGNIPTTLEGFTQGYLLKVSQLMILLNITYFTAFEGFTGQTIGKKLLGIIVYEEEGKKLGLASALLRRIGLVVPLLNFVDGLAILATSKNQRIFDIIASTLVLKVEYEDESVRFLKGENIAESLEEKTDRMNVRELEERDKENMVEKLKEKKSQLEKKFEDGKIEEDEYREIKAKYQSRIKTLEKRRRKKTQKDN